MTQTPTYFWRRLSPLIFIAPLLAFAEIGAQLAWRNALPLGAVAMATLIGSLGLLFGLKAVLQRLGADRPGKQFVAEVVILHWRGETPRFWGAYRHEWLAGFAAQYVAYLMDHFGNVHWEFGIQFRVHDREQHADAASGSGDTCQPA